MFEILAHSAFTEIAALLLLAAAAGLLGAMLRQPLIVSFIAVGLMAGPSAFGIVRSEEQIGLLAELGVAVLLFLVGIKLDVKLIRSLGAVSLMTGLGQVLFTSVIGFAIGIALGLDNVTSLYVAVALTFSSTIIIVKLLSDKREIDSLHGQIALGFLIVQDLVVVFAMVVLSAFGIGAAAAGGLDKIATIVGAAAGLVATVVLFIRFIADPLTERLAKTPELLVVFGIAIAAILAAVAESAGLGKELGGLLAGVALASSAYRETIVARLSPLRDFLLLFFFVALGAGLDLTLLGGHAVAAAVFSLFVLIGNPLIVLMIMGAMGYRKRTGFLAGLTVAQISEFSLIFMAMGVSLGHVDPASLGLVTMVGIITIAASTYMITYSHHLYALFEPVLSPFERKDTPREPHEDGHHDSKVYDVILFGLGRFGSAIAVRLRAKGVGVLGVDFNPEAVRRARLLGIDAHFGDATDPEYVTTLPLRHAKWVVATVPAHVMGLSFEDARATLLQILKSERFPVRVAMTSHFAVDSKALTGLGADVVIEPYQDAADRAVEVLMGGELLQRVDLPEIEAEIRAR